MTYTCECIITCVCTITLASKQYSVLTGHDQERGTVFVVEFFYFIHSNSFGYLDFSNQSEILQIDLKNEIHTFECAVKRLFYVTGIYCLNIFEFEFLR